MAALVGAARRQIHPGQVELDLSAGAHPRPGMRCATLAPARRCGRSAGVLRVLPRTRGLRDGKTLTLRENLTKAVVAGEKHARIRRFVI